MAISEFVYHRRVQFPETDASGIVHFTNFFKYVEEAEHALWRAAGMSIAERSQRFQLAACGGVVRLQAAAAFRG